MYAVFVIDINTYRSVDKNCFIRQHMFLKNTSMTKIDNELPGVNLYKLHVYHVTNSYYGINCTYGMKQHASVLY